GCDLSSDSDQRIYSAFYISCPTQGRVLRRDETERLAAQTSLVKGRTNEDTSRRPPSSPSSEGFECMRQWRASCLLAREGKPLAELPNLPSTSVLYQN